MAAGLRIYDPATGNLIFNTDDGLTRLLGQIGTGLTSGTITVPSEVLGGGTLFWYPLNFKSQNDDVKVQINHNQLSYTKLSDSVLIYGVYV